MATDKNIKEDIWKKVGELDEIPPHVNFNPDRVWAKLQARMEAERHSSLPRGAIFLMIAILGVIIAVGIGVALNKSVPTEPVKTQQSTQTNSTIH